MMNIAGQKISMLFIKFNVVISQIYIADLVNEQRKEHINLTNDSP